MSDLEDLYQEVLLDHNRSPRNFRALESANRHAEGYNPLCGDRFTVFLRTEDGVIREAAFQGSGCAISKASASVMTESLREKSKSEVDELFRKFRDMVTGVGTNGFDPLELGELGALSGVSRFPIRVKCATLAWHTMKAALEGKDPSVSTE